MKKRAGILAVLLAALTGCSAEMTEEDLSDLHFGKAAVMLGEKTPEERALSVKNKLGQLEEVIATAVIVEGHTAIIGLRLEENTEQMRISAVKEEAEAAARAADEYIETVSVTTNPYVVSLIEELERSRAH